VSIRGYKGLKIFENFVPQFPKKEAKGCFPQLNNKHYLGKSVSSVVPLSSYRVVSIFATGRIRPTADVVTEDIELKVYKKVKNKY
jgi:hypothetical protein